MHLNPLPNFCHDIVPPVEVEGIEDEILKRVLKILLANGLIGDLEDNVADDEKKVELFEVLS